VASRYNAKRDYGSRGSLLDSYEIEFAGRKGAIYRRADSASQNYQFRLYVREQKTYIRKSLGTAIHKEAVALAQREIAKIDGVVSSGQRINSISVLDATKDYLKHLESAVSQGARSSQSYKAGLSLPSRKTTSKVTNSNRHDRRKNDLCRLPQVAM